MRTTIDLPDDLHRVLMGIARDSGTTLSDTVSRLLEVALGAPGPVALSTSRVTGLRLMSTGRPVTSGDVRSLDDEE